MEIYNTIFKAGEMDYKFLLLVYRPEHSEGGNFMRKAAMLLMISLIAGTMSGCSGGAKQNGTAESTKTETIVSQEQGEDTGQKELDVLRIGVADLPKHMDPMRDVGNTGIRIHYNIFETLLLADQKDSFNQKPMIAESWERLDDYTVEFKLRKDIKFHNGDGMTSKDVKYSFDRLKKDLSGLELASSLMLTIKEVEIVDDYTVRLLTDIVDPILEDRVASSWGSWILPADYLEEVGDEAFALKPVGTGPYKVVSYSPQKIELERFEDYWGEKPAAKRIEYIVYPETAARITALVTGELDIIAQLPPDQVATVEADNNLRVISKNIANMHALRFNTQYGPLKDKRLRQALALAIDRQLLADTLWGGKAIVPKGHQYVEYGDMYFDDYPVAEYNLEKAKKLVAESDYNGEPINYELRNGYYTFGNEAAEAIVDMWKAIGVNAQVKFVEKQEMEQISNWSNSMRFPDPAGGLWLLWGEGSTPSKVHWVDMPQEFVDRGRELSSITDENRRKELAREMMEIWDDEAPGALLYYPFESWGIRKGLDWEPYSSQTMDFRADNFKVTE